MPQCFLFHLSCASGGMDQEDNGRGSREREPLFSFLLSCVVIVPSTTCLQIYCTAVVQCRL